MPPQLLRSWKQSGLLSLERPTSMNLVWGMSQTRILQDSVVLFWYSSHSTNSHYGSVKSHLGQRNEPLSAGGSSGGSAIAVATGQCLAWAMSFRYCRTWSSHITQSSWYRHRWVCTSSSCIHRHRGLQTIVRHGISLGSCCLCKFSRYSWCACL